MAGQNINWWDSDRGKRKPVIPEPISTPVAAPVPESAPVVEKAAPAPIQTTPVIQPFVVVPYSTPMQPLMHYSDGTLPIGDIDSDYIRANGGMMNPMMGAQPMAQPMGGMPPMQDDVFFNMDEDSEKITRKREKKARSGKRLSALKVFVILFIALFGTLTLFIEPLLSLLIEDPNVSFVTSGETKVTLFDSFKTVIAFFTEGPMDFAGIFSDMLLLVQFALVLGSVFMALVGLIALFSLRRKRFPVIAKIFAFLAFALVAAGLIIGFVKGFAVGYAGYALTGIALLIFLLTLIGRKEGKKIRRSRGRRR